MKRFLLIAGTAALLMTSCSEEKFLNESGLQQATDANKGTIEFKASRPNQSRAALEEFTSNFGVFGIKANNVADIPEDYTVNTGSNDPQLVFNNYLVGHNSIYPFDEGGYTEAGLAQDRNNVWYYEGLGKEEYYTPTGVTESYWNNQFLKYWDANKAYTYFVAYTPYNNTANSPTLTKLDPDDNDGYFLKLACQSPITLDDQFMFASKREKVADHTGGTQSTVTLDFIRCQSQIRIAFYEVIRGYKVKMIKVNDTKGVTAMPYDPASTKKLADGTTPDYFGSIMDQVTPVIKFKEPTPVTTNSTALNYDLDLSDKEVDESYVFNFDIKDLYFNSPEPVAANHTDCLEETRDKKAFSTKVYNVFPNSTTDALQFVLSFTLEAEDTGEVITVNHARVTIPADYTVWKANCLYTYVFKITKDTNGSTTPGTDDPEVPITPDPNPALYPIVFDQLTVADMTVAGNTTEYTLYDSGSDHQPTATEAFIFKSGEIGASGAGIPKDFVEVSIGGSLDLKGYMEDAYVTKYNDAVDAGTTPFPFAFSSDDTTIATVNATTGVVSPVAPGTTAIHVEYTADGVTVKDAILVTVIANTVLLRDAKWDFSIYAPYDIYSMLRDNSKGDNITWYFYQPANDSFKELKNGDDTADYSFSVSGSQKNISFKVAGNKYLLKAVYKEGDATEEKTDYFFVKVLANTVLTIADQTCISGVAFALNSLLADSADADKVAWTIAGTALTDEDATTTNYSYVAADNELTFKTAAEGQKFLCKAVKTVGSNTTTEYFYITVVAP